MQENTLSINHAIVVFNVHSCSLLLFLLLLLLLLSSLSLFLMTCFDGFFFKERSEIVTVAESRGWF